MANKFLKKKLQSGIYYYSNEPFNKTHWTLNEVNKTELSGMRLVQKMLRVRVAGLLDTLNSKYKFNTNYALIEKTTECRYLNDGTLCMSLTDISFKINEDGEFRSDKISSEKAKVIFNSGLELVDTYVTELWSDDYLPYDNIFAKSSWSFKPSAVNYSGVGSSIAI